MTKKKEENQPVEESTIKSSVQVLRDIVALKDRGENRPQQEEMVEFIEQAIKDETHILVEGPTGSGKALHVDTPILTKNGWSTMGMLNVGDIIYDESGKETTVTHTYPILEDRLCYEVIFSDGSKIVADAEHLWSTSTRSLRNKTFYGKKRKRIQISSEGLLDLKNRIENDYEYISQTLEMTPVGLARRYNTPYGISERAASKISVSSIRGSYGISYYNTRALLEATYVEMVSLVNCKVNGFELDTLTTEDIKNTLFYNNLTHKNHAIPVVSNALDFTEKTLPIQPYVLGAWLGDGNSNGSGFTCFDEEIIDRIVTNGYFIRDNQTNGRYSIDIENEVSHRWRDSFVTKLRNINVLDNKHIPSVYLLSSKKQRLELLAGFIDTDGSVDASGSIEFYASNELLANQVKFLVNSLGIKASLRSKVPTNTTTNKAGKVAYTVTFKINLKVMPDFKIISRKMSKLVDSQKTYSHERNNLRYIVDVKKIDSVPVRCITVDSPTHLFLAGETLIPTHNSMSYLVPVLQSGKQAVISTATKQLSEQIVENELPFLQKSLLKTNPQFTATDFALLKGRENYLCAKKFDDQLRLEAQARRQSKEQLDMFDEIDSKNKLTGVAVEVRAASEWANLTKTGDRSEAPPVSDKVWRQFSSTSTECPGKSNCPFGKECFAEIARERAREAQIVVTNHAVVANDLMGEGTMLGEREVLVLDELHELDNYLSNAWGASITIKFLRDNVREFKRANEVSDNTIKGFDEAIDELEPYFLKANNGLLENTSAGFVDALKTIRKYATATSTTLQKSLTGKGATGKKEIVGSLKKRADEIVEAMGLLLDESKETVRWFTVPEEEYKPRFGKKKPAADTPQRAVTLNAAPLRVGPKLINSVNGRGMTIIGTSATIRVTGGFEIPVHNLALDTQETHRTLAVESPFDFSKQAMLYIPPSNVFPAPVGAERKAHSEAVLQESLDLILASNGRALVLSTTQYGANMIAEFLRTKLLKKNIKVLLQGEAPQAQLVEEFRQDETSVLVATMGLWHGLDVQGPSLSLVIIDKIPFKPMDDPLSNARQKYAQDSGRNGFMDVYVADANIMLAQGVGRLIRHTEDKGVVAILDTRLTSKPYGRSMLKSLPPMKLFNKKDIVISALKRLTNGEAKK